MFHLLTKMTSYTCFTYSFQLHRHVVVFVFHAFFPSPETRSICVPNSGHLFRSRARFTISRVYILYKVNCCAPCARSSHKSDVCSLCLAYLPHCHFYNCHRFPCSVDVRVEFFITVPVWILMCIKKDGINGLIDDWNTN